VGYLSLSSVHQYLNLDQNITKSGVTEVQNGSDAAAGKARCRPDANNSDWAFTEETTAAYEAEPCSPIRLVAARCGGRRRCRQPYAKPREAAAAPPGLCPATPMAAWGEARVFSHWVQVSCLPI
jgi:hypothetical protein